MKSLAIALALLLSCRAAGQFSSPQLIACEFIPYSAATGDLDGDGSPDVVFSDDDGNIRWYKNAGSGYYGAAFDIAHVAGARPTVMTGDLDGDNDLDVLAWWSPTFSGTVAWHENDGAGAFSEQQVIATYGQRINSLQILRWDNDNLADIVTASELSNISTALSWHKNEGGGSFSGQAVLETFPFPIIELKGNGDLDGDGDADLLADMPPFDLFFFPNLDGPMLGVETAISPNGFWAGPVKVADLDGDGDNDVLAGSESGHLAWFENEGSSFSVHQLIASPSPLETPTSLAAADLDGDGKLDVAAAFEDDKVNWHRNLGGGEFSQPATVTLDVNEPFFIAAEDFDSDGHADIVSLSKWDKKLAWHPNPGAGDFSSQVVLFISGGAQSVQAADMDGDGDQDVLASTWILGWSSIVWYPNDGNGNFGPPQFVAPFNDGGDDILALDLDGDTLPDVLNASHAQDKVGWYKNLGAGLFDGQEQVITDQLNGAAQPFAGDLDDDGDQDVLAFSNFNDKLVWFENLGAGSFGAQQELVSGSDHLARTGDMDGDGDDDLVVGFLAQDVVKWLENHPPGHFDSIHVVSAAAGNIVDVALVKIDGDTDLDIASVTFSNFDERRIVWYENLNSSDAFSLEKEIFPADASVLRYLRAADLDGDGDPDLASTADIPGLVRWHEHFGGSSFSSPGELTTESTYITALQAADLDGNDKADLIVILDEGKIIWWKSLLVATPTSTAAVQARALDVYPNPAGDFFRLRLPESMKPGLEIHLCDVFGKTVRSARSTGEKEWICFRQDLPPGMYFLHVLVPESEAGTCVGKVVFK